MGKWFLFKINEVYQQALWKLSSKCSLKFLGKKIPKVFPDSERKSFWRCSQTSFWISSNALFGMTYFGKYSLIGVLWLQDRFLWLVFTWVKRTPQTNKFLEEKGCRNIMERLFSASVKKSVCTCIRKKTPGIIFPKFSVFVSCLEQWGRTILADELKSSFYQPEISFPETF